MTNQLHNFEQVKDILDYGIQLHVELRELYERLTEESDQARVKMVLEYLSRHERNREQAMRRFEEGTRKGILDTWLQYTPGSKIEQLMAVCIGKPVTSVDDAVTMALGFDEALIGLYRDAAREIDDPRVQTVFQNLADMEDHERQRFVRDSAWVQDI